jgi:hypothetical protein
MIFAQGSALMSQKNFGESPVVKLIKLQQKFRKILGRMSMPKLMKG